MGEGGEGRGRRGMGVEKAAERIDEETYFPYFPALSWRCSCLWRAGGSA